MMRRHSSVTVIAALSAALAAATTARGRATEPVVNQRAQPAPPAFERLAEMQHHFLQVALVHEAVIRGDLPAVKAPATELAGMPTPPGTTSVAEPFVEATRVAARRAAQATDLASAASATAMMLRQCGACHQTVVRPVPSTTIRPDVGGLVGHMLDHQRAVDELLQGLIIPSASLWSRGAERLRVRPLPSGELPPDPALTEDLARADARVHQIGAMAVGARDAVARGAAYAELLTTCAECHRLHAKVWGPGAAPTRGAGS